MKFGIEDSPDVAIGSTEPNAVAIEGKLPPLRHNLAHILYQRRLGGYMSKAEVLISSCVSQKSVISPIIRSSPAASSSGVRPRSVHPPAGGAMGAERTLMSARYVDDVPQRAVAPHLQKQCWGQRDRQVGLRLTPGRWTPRQSTMVLWQEHPEDLANSELPVVTPMLSEFF